MKIGVLDFCFLRKGLQASDILAETIGLVPLVESMGYSRYWFTEHHTPEAAHCCPELMLAAVAGLTSTIRVGAAGVLLRYYSPFKVASEFRLLHALYPGRIDLGLASAFIDPAIEQLLVADSGDYEEKVAQLVDFLRDSAAAKVTPSAIAPPEVWILGQSKSVSLAALHGTAFCFGMFLGPNDPETCVRVVNEYRRGFRPSEGLQEPQASIAVAGICAESERDARRLLAEHVDLKVTTSVVGDPGQCREQIEELCVGSGANEIIFLDLCNTLQDRIRSYELLAQACDLTSEPRIVQAKA